MFRYKKLFTVLIALLAVISFAGSAAADPIRIITTIFPEYDWVRNILGENPAGAELTLLLDNGVDLHSYQPTADDILKITDCDLFIYIGGESDSWVEDALKEARNRDMVVLNLLDTLGDMAREEEVVEGMQDAHDHEHDHDHEEDHDHEDEHGHEEAELDEHIWLSLGNAAFLCEKISGALVALDPENGEVYRANTEAYLGKLKDLDERYRQAVDAAPVKTLLFGDRFPFRYLTDDYGLDYYAAFTGCSAETEASFETVIFLTKKVDELGLNTVMTIEGRDHRIAETIARSTETKDQKILTMDSMQSVTGNDIRNGVTYLSVMERNLEVLREALQ